MKKRPKTKRSAVLSLLVFKDSFDSINFFKFFFLFPWYSILPFSSQTGRKVSQSRHDDDIQQDKETGE